MHNPLKYAILLLATAVPLFAQAFPDSGTLHTEAERAEIRLAADVYLRLGEHSAARMILARTGSAEIELLAGSAIVDSTHATATFRITVRVGDNAVELGPAGDYRFDFTPARLRVDRGEAILTDGRKAVAGQTLALGAGVPDPQPDGFLDVWSANRRIRVNTIYASGSPPRDEVLPAPHPGPDLPGAQVGLFPLTGIPALMQQPIHPYREGVGFFGPASGYGLPSPDHVPFGPQVPNVIHGTGVPHFPTVVGH